MGGHSQVWLKLSHGFRENAPIDGAELQETYGVTRVAEILMGILFVVGVARIVFFLRGRTAFFRERGQPVGERNHVFMGFFNVAFAVWGLVFLRFGTEDPWDILFAILLAELIFEVAFRKTAIL